MGKEDFKPKLPKEDRVKDLAAWKALIKGENKSDVNVEHASVFRERERIDEDDEEHAERMETEKEMLYQFQADIITELYKDPPDVVVTKEIFDNFSRKGLQRNKLLATLDYVGLGAFYKYAEVHLRAKDDTSVYDMLRKFIDLGVDERGLLECFAKLTKNK